MFAYCGNNPVNYADANGENPWLVVAIAGGMAVVSGISCYFSGGDTTEIALYSLSSGLSITEIPVVSQIGTIGSALVAGEMQYRQTNSLLKAGIAGGIELIPALATEKRIGKIANGVFKKSLVKDEVKVYQFGISILNNISSYFFTSALSSSKSSVASQRQPWLKMHIQPIHISRVHINIQFSYERYIYTYRAPSYNFDFSAVSLAYQKIASLS